MNTTTNAPRALSDTDQLLALDFEIPLSRPTELFARALLLHHQLVGADAFYYRLRDDFVAAVLDDFECAHDITLTGAARLYLLDVAVAYYCAEIDPLP